MALFPEAWMDELLSKNDIASVVAEYVELTPKGRRLWGCCPFHSEKTPSFSVSADKQMYYCFGCHAGGGVVQFIKEMEKLNYPEAVAFLARRVNMELPSEINDEQLRRERALKERLYNACRDAAMFYHKQLMGDNGVKAREYLAKRGIDRAAVTRFGIGYAPEGWEDLKKHMLEKGYREDELISAGLAVKGKSGRVYDAYRARVIFPIIAANERVVAFGARTMIADETPKYINTGDTPIYSKRANLYAINLLKGKKIDDIIMVEGYMDAIRLHSAGIDNAVASLGTALTAKQAKLIKRYVSKAFIAYDGDSAGRNATLRGLDILAAEGIDVKVITIPDDMDPDDFVKKYGAEAFLKLKDSARTLEMFKLDFMSQSYDLMTDDGREKYAESACNYIAKLKPVIQRRYCKYIAEKTGISLEAIVKQCELDSKDDNANSFALTRNNRDKKSPSELSEREKCELTILACALMGKDVFVRIRKHPDFSVENVFVNDDIKGCYKAIAECYERGETPNIGAILAAMPGDEQMLTPALIEQESITDGYVTAADCIERITVIDLKNKLQSVANGMKNASGDKRMRLSDEYAALIKELKQRNKS